MSAMLSRLGFALRETGQALDRLGCRLRGSEVYLEESASELKEEKDLIRSPPLPSLRTSEMLLLPLASLCSPSVQFCRIRSPLWKLTDVFYALT